MARSRRSARWLTRRSQDYVCVEKAFLCASIVKGGKESVVNGLVAIVVEEEDTLRMSEYLRRRAGVARGRKMCGEFAALRCKVSQ